MGQRYHQFLGLKFITKFTEASISIVIHYALIINKCTRLTIEKSITCFQLTPPVPAGGVKTSGVFKLFQTLFFRRQSLKKEKKAVWPRETSSDGDHASPIKPPILFDEGLLT